MATPANERMRAWRDRQRRSGRREVRMVLPDARLPGARERVATSVAGLDQQDDEDGSLGSEVSEFDAHSAR